MLSGIWKALDGKKFHISVILGVINNIGVMQGWYTADVGNMINVIVAGLLGVTFRDALRKLEPQE